MKKTIEDKVREVIHEELGTEMSKIIDGARFIDDLGADELDFVEILMATEEAFMFAITDEDAEKIKTVGDLIDHVKAKSQHSAPM